MNFLIINTHFYLGDEYMNRKFRRKFKKFFSKNQTLVLFITLFIMLAFMSTGYALLKTDLLFNSTSKIVTDSSIISDPDDKAYDCKTVITYEITNSWTGNYIINFTISNNGERKINNWKIKFADSNDITAVSSAAGNVTKTDGYYYISGMTWNSSIESGSSISAQAQISTSRTDIDSILKNIIIVSCGRATSGGTTQKISSGKATLDLGQLEKQINASIEITEAGAWGGAVNIYKVTITNSLDVAITDWRGMIYYGDTTLNSVYPCNTTRNDDAKNIIVSNTSSGDGALDPGSSISITLVLNTKDTTYIPDYIFAGTVAA